MLKKPLILASAAALALTATLSTPAEAGDPVAGAIIGGILGAAIGHGADGAHGARVGGALGALAGASIAASEPYYYERGYYYGPAYPSSYYYGPRYYYPAPVAVVRAPTIVYRSTPSYRHDRGWRGHDRRDRHDRRWH